MHRFSARLLVSRYLTSISVWVNRKRTTELITNYLQRSSRLGHFPAPLDNYFGAEAWKHRERDLREWIFRETGFA